MRARVWLILAGGLIVPGLILACFEIVARLFFPYGVSPLISHPVLNHVWRPNSEWLHTEFQSRGVPPYLHRYNAQSWLEDYDVNLLKEQGVVRIFIVGDSFTEGTVPMDSSLPSRLEQALNRGCCFEPEGVFAKNSRFEVINTGTSSYSPLLYYLLIKNTILRFQPDIVVINVDMTDVFDDSLYRKAAVFSKDDLPLAVPPYSQVSRSIERTAKGVQKRDFSSKVRQALSSRSVFFAFLYQVLDTMRSRKSELHLEQREGELFSWCKGPWSVETREKVDFSFLMLERSIDLLRSKRVQVVLSAVPHLEHFTGEFSTRPLAAIEDLAWNKGIPYIDGYSHLMAYAEVEEVRQLYIQNDMHFNQRGYSLWSEAFVEFFKNSEALSTSQSK